MLLEDEVGKRGTQFAFLACTSWRWSSQKALVVKSLSAMQESEKMKIRSLGPEDPLEEGIVTQYSCLENPMDRGAWQAKVHSMAKSQPRLK